MYAQSSLNIPACSIRNTFMEELDKLFGGGGGGGLKSLEHLMILIGQALF